MPMPDRMKLAEGKPLPRRMMAAMAQQDCGQCGYNCKDYADALFAKKEKRLNLCVPGGKETARMLKQLYRGARRRRAAPARCSQLPSQAGAHVARPAARATIRSTPRSSRAAGSTSPARKKKPGTSNSISPDAISTMWSATRFGIFPANDPALVDAVLAALDAPADFPIGERTLREVLTDGVSLSPAPDMLFQLISYLTGGERRQKAKALAAGEDPGRRCGDARRARGLAKISRHPARSGSLHRVARSVAAARLFDLVVAQSAIPAASRSRSMPCATQSTSARGSASPRPFSPAASQPGDKIRVYVQKAQHFALPADPAKPIIMIGPGTGIAPFRAFLQERQATKAPGRNWLFFGHQRSDYDFFYEDELSAMRAAGLLTRLTLAWSRDANEKIYVQHRMREVGRDLWSWINDGAHIYVCGDALRMAKDVETRAGRYRRRARRLRAPEEAAAFVAELKKSGRYQTDVY